MKKSIYALLLSSLVATSTTFAMSIPLLSYTWNSGTTIAKNHQTETCIIYSDKVVKVKRFARLKPEESQTQTAYTATIKKSDDVFDLMEKAVNSKNIEKQTTAPAGTSEVYTILRRGPTGRTMQTIIKSTRDNPILNKSRAAKALIDFVDFNCRDQ